MADKNFLTEIIDADLAEGKISEIHTRFPPEPNGYLHIGSAKAIYINWSIANQYGGKFNLRLDDTNPAREGEERLDRKKVRSMSTASLRICTGWALTPTAASSMAAITLTSATSTPRSSSWRARPTWTT